MFHSNETHNRLFNERRVHQNSRAASVALSALKKHDTKTNGVEAMRAFIAVIILVPMLFGCATTKSTISKRYIASSQSKLSITISKSPEVLIPEEQYQLIESQIRDGLAKSDLLSGGDVSPQHSVVVKLQSFRMRPDAARLTVGIMAGCDKINSEVVVTNIQTQEEIGKSNVSITECAAWGVASQVIKKYTDGVVAYLSNKNR